MYGMNATVRKVVGEGDAFKGWKAGGDVQRDMALLKYAADILLIRCAMYTHEEKMQVFNQIAGISGHNVDSLVRDFEASQQQA